MWLVACGCTVYWLDSRRELLGEGLDGWLECNNVCGVEDWIRTTYLIRYLYSKLPSR